MNTTTTMLNNVTIETRNPMPVFVYGTLRPGEGNYGWALSGKTVEETESFLPGTSMYSNGGFPYLIEESGAQGVYGTLVDIAPKELDEVMQSMDQLEGTRNGEETSMGKSHPGNHYNRVARLVKIAANHFVKAWVYLPPVEDQARIKAGNVFVESGDWYDRPRVVSRFNLHYEAPRVKFTPQYSVDNKLTEDERAAIEEFLANASTI